MDEKPDQILGHIEAQRSELGRNLNELETRVRRGTDWRTYFDKNPMMMLGAALGGGLLLGTAVARRKHHRGTRSRHHSSSLSSSSLGFASAGAMSSSSSGSSRMAGQRHEVAETLEHVKAALVGFGIAKAKEFMCEAIPGFDQHLSEAEQKHKTQRHDSDSSSASTGSRDQGAEWESDMYSSGGRDNAGGRENSSSFGNSGSGSSGQAGYRGSRGSGEPVGSTPLVTP